MTAEDLLYERFKDGLQFLMEQGKKELILQGHKVTGNLERSFESVVKTVFGKTVGQILVESYGVKLNAFQKPNELGDFTTHYKDLVSWAALVKSDLTPSEQKRFAYATAANHFVFGIPLAGSYEFSDNGRRTEWLTYSIEDETNLNVFFDLLDLPSVLEAAFNNMISELQTLKIAS